MKLVTVIIYSCWLASEVLLGRLKRAGAGDQKRADNNSLLSIWIVIACSTTLAATLSNIIPMAIAHNSSIRYAGLALIVLGMSMRFIVIRSLGRFFTVDVAIREGHQLKTDGFYAVIRHPSYLASWLSFVGFGISLNNWISLGIVAVSVMGVFLYRISIEERVLIVQFGETYLHYKKKTKAIIPMVY